MIHEIAHHFGIDDDRLHELGLGDYLASRRKLTRHAADLGDFASVRAETGP